MAIPGEYLGASFVELLRRRHPDLVPRWEAMPTGTSLIQATTIGAIRYEGGVVIGGDRRATLDGHLIMNEDVVKVFKVDDHSAMAIAGAFGPSVKMVKLFQVELEHYDKIEGEPLTLDGKANKLSSMIEMNFPAAMQGMVVMPIFVGWDLAAGHGKIYEYDVTGGMFSMNAKEPYVTSGSGGDRARTTFEHFWKPDIDREGAIALLERALAFAAKRDAATGSFPPILMCITRDGVEIVRGE